MSKKYHSIRKVNNLVEEVRFDIGKYTKLLGNYNIDFNQVLDFIKVKMQSFMKTNRIKTYIHKREKSQKKYY